jgi:hypothetical protein
LAGKTTDLLEGADNLRKNGIIGLSFEKSFFLGLYAVQDNFFEREGKNEHLTQ